MRPVSLLRCSRCLGQSPPCQRGVPRHRRGGGIPQAGRFPHGFVLSESACCNPSVTATPCQLPLAREPLGCSDEAPLAKGGWFGEAKPGGFPRLAGFHIGLYFQEVPPVNPSVKNQRFLPAPFGKGVLGCSGKQGARCSPGCCGQAPPFPL